MEQLLRLITLKIFYMLKNSLVETWILCMKKKDWLAVTAVSALLAAGAWVYVPTTASAVVLGSAVTVGVLTHLAGDSITKNGIPLLAPLVPLGRRRWWKFRLPKPFRISASGPADRLLLAVFSLLVAAQTVAVASGLTVS